MLYYLIELKKINEQNKIECQENCEYSEYLPESKYLSTVNEIIIKIIIIIINLENLNFI